ncbi:helix-turn-helix domain-containing protein [Streptomyces sp. NPDC097610]|uniref:helix-turn-helix domain-containing protein n=1 Tax=Streptomyces sp. NPDC097610 TaxID=3157227 RepID=UPI00332062FB
MLSLAEREEISRGLAADDSFRAIAGRMGRAPSTVSREVGRHGGREKYRAARTDEGAWGNARRPKSCLLGPENADSRSTFLTRDRDSKFTQAFDAVLADTGLRTARSGARMSRMNSIMERWIQTCRRELPDRTLIWFETFHNEHRPHRTLEHAAPLRPLPEPISTPGHISHLGVHRQDRLGGTLHEYRHVA